ncbi:MAG: methyltransferase domain-containing protein [Candidatus Eremiobacteraeota bacterium]|nr:methyltransferase domain-containing protein [Candidatus Eremiobacteraeota bacterium]MCW5865831.1 methyltransferase domain-containing protein [Candidatus Eremiobacteraeota bacterium]
MNWWEGFFDEEYARHFLPAQVEEQAGQIARLLELKPGQRVFDQCCGQGRFSRALAQLGILPVGVDACADYVEAARAACPEGRFFCADASGFHTEDCHGGMNVYSSFGYSADDRFNLDMLKCARHSLRPGGRFLLETINFANVLVNFQPTIVTHLDAGLILERHSRLDWQQGMLRQEWILRRPDQSCRHHSTCTRILLPRELGEMLRAAGLEPERMLGNLAGEEFAQDNPRVVWLARRCS